jgi:hypothetical protein
MKLEPGKFYRYAGDAVSPGAYPHFRGWIFQAGRSVDTGWIIYPGLKSIWAILDTDIYEELTDEEVLMYKMGEQP